MKDFEVDRDRAIKVAAIAGLAVLALTILPGLLRTPDPPEIPSDVGFRPTETGAKTMPSPSRKAGPDSVEMVKADRKHRRGERRSEPLAKRDDKSRMPPRNRSKRPQKRASRTDVEANSGAPGPSRARPSTVPTSTPAPAPAVPAAPAPAPAAPAPPPAPDPPRSSPPPSSGRPIPADGSQEFAPR